MTLKEKRKSKCQGGAHSLGSCSSVLLSLQLHLRPLGGTAPRKPSRRIRVAGIGPDLSIIKRTRSPATAMTLGQDVDRMWGQDIYPHIPDDYLVYGGVLA